MFPVFVFHINFDPCDGKTDHLRCESADEKGSNYDFLDMIF